MLTSAINCTFFLIDFLEWAWQLSWKLKVTGSKCLLKFIELFSEISLYMWIFLYLGPDGLSSNITKLSEDWLKFALIIFWLFSFHLVSVGGFDSLFQTGWIHMLFQMKTPSRIEYYYNPYEKGQENCTKHMTPLTNQQQGLQ